MRCARTALTVGLRNRMRTGEHAEAHAYGAARPLRPQVGRHGLRQRLSLRVACMCWTRWPGSSVTGRRVSAPRRALPQRRSGCLTRSRSTPNSGQLGTCSRHNCSAAWGTFPASICVADAVTSVGLVHWMRVAARYAGMAFSRPYLAASAPSCANAALFRPLCSSAGERNPGLVCGCTAFKRRQLNAGAVQCVRACPSLEEPGAHDLRPRSSRANSSPPLLRCVPLARCCPHSASGWGG